MKIFRFGLLTVRQGFPALSPGSPCLTARLRHACSLSLRKEDGCGEARLVRAFARTSETSGFLHDSCVSARREKVAVCQRKTVALAKAGPGTFCTKPQSGVEALAAAPPRISKR